MTDATREREHVSSRWRSGLRLFLGVTGARYAITFGSQILLARILLPADFGDLALVMTIVNACLAMVTLHSDKYLVQLGRDARDATNAAFTAETVVSVGMYAALWFAGPLILGYLGRADLVHVLHIYGLVLLVNPIVAVRGQLLRELSYRSIYVPLLYGVAVHAAVSLGLALLGWRVWALVVGKVAGQLVEILFIWSKARPYPRITTSIEGMRPVLAYGLPLTGASILVFFYWHIDYVVIERLVGITALGYYFLAFQLNQHFLQLRLGLNQVAYPILAKQRDGDFADVFVRLTWLNALVHLFPAAICLGAGDTLIHAVFGEGWAPAATPFKTLMVLTAWRGITGHIDSILMLRGRNRTLFALTLLNCLVVPAAVVPLTYSFGVDGAAAGVTLGMLATSPLIVRALESELDVEFWCIIQRPLIAFSVAVVATSLLQLVAPINLFGALILMVAGGSAFFGAMVLVDRVRLMSLIRNRRQWLLTGASISDRKGLKVCA